MSTRPAFFASLLGAFVFLVSCSSMYVSHSHEPNRLFPGDPNSTLSDRGRNAYPPYSGVVEVYESEEQLADKKYESLGMVTARSRLEYPEGRPEMLILLQRRAAEKGANAIVLQGEEESRTREFNTMKARAIRIIRHGTY